MLRIDRLFILVLMLTGLSMALLPRLSFAQAGQQQVVPLRKVAVLPFVAIRPRTSGERMVRGILKESYFRSGELPDRAASKVTSLFYQHLANLGRCDLISRARTTALMGPEEQAALKRDPLSEAVRQGEAVRVYAVVIGAVYRFEERQGGPLGVEKPASVAFDAHLIRTDDRKVIWSGTVDQTQRALSENLLRARTFVRGGGKWVTVEELTSLGIESSLGTFPYLSLER